jgi:NADPH:quinone reductase-like Zn-dependent oxidoreductase
LISTLMEPSAASAATRSALGMRYTAQESGVDLAEIAALIDEGLVRPVVARTFHLNEAAAAQRFLETQHPAGKVVLTVP